MSEPLRELLHKAHELAEEWRPIIGFEGFYEVSNRGAVRSLVNHQGTRRLRSVRLSPNQQGYLQFTMRQSGRKVCKRVHTAVLESFVGPKPDGFQACHGDGVKTHNSLANLRWGTPKSNYEDKVRHQTESKLSHDDVRCIRAEPDWRGVAPMLARAFNVAPRTIRMIRKGVTRSEVPQYL